MNKKKVSAREKTACSCNGSHQKRVKGEFGKQDIVCSPRDREAGFTPLIHPEGQDRFTGFDDKIIALYARGMITCDSQAQLEEMDNVEVSPILLLQVLPSVQEDAGPGRPGPLDLAAIEGAGFWLAGVTELENRGERYFYWRRERPQGLS